MVTMTPGQIIVDEVDCYDKKIYCSTRPDIQTPKRTGENIQVFGGFGDLIYDHQGYENTSMTLELWRYGRSDLDLSTNRREINKIFQQMKYLKIRFWFDPEVIYECQVIEPAVFVNKRWYDGTQTFDIGLSIKPFKRFISSVTYPEKIVLTNGMELKNPTNEVQYPLIKITGENEASFSIGNTTMRIRDIENHIYIDSENFFLYKDQYKATFGQNYKTNDLVYPAILPNNKNKIKWSGQISSVEIWPRWRTLV